MELIQTYTFEKLSVALQSTLQKSVKLFYVPDESIIITSLAEKDVIPTFVNYLIKLSAPDEGFLTKIPRIGNHYRNIYVVAIELWVKSSAKLTERLTMGNLAISKGLYEFFQDISDVLEHNNLDGQLNPYPGSTINNPVLLKSNDTISEGIGFLWFGNQYNTK